MSTITCPICKGDGLHPRSSTHCPVCLGAGIVANNWNQEAAS